MLFLPFMKIQQGAGRGLLTRGIALGTIQGRIGEEQGGQLLAQRRGIHVAEQQIQGAMFDGVEGDGAVDRLGMDRGLGVEHGLCLGGQDRFQPSQIDRRMEILAHGFGADPAEILQPQAGLEQTIKRFHAPTQRIEFQELGGGIPRRCASS